jgi:hypothetical protein
MQFCMYCTYLDILTQGVRSWRAGHIAGAYDVWQRLQAEYGPWTTQEVDCLGMRYMCGDMDFWSGGMQANNNN